MFSFDAEAFRNIVKEEVTAAVKELVPPKEPKILKIADVAKMAQVNPKTVYNWVKTGKLTPINTPGALRFIEAEVYNVLLRRNDSSDELLSNQS